MENKDQKEQRADRGEEAVEVRLRLLVEQK